jgi:ElaB/YqjD/DUF883 family membrane-anchored ribosome-binding protein
MPNNPNMPQPGQPGQPGQPAQPGQQGQRPQGNQGLQGQRPQGQPGLPGQQGLPSQRPPQVPGVDELKDRAVQGAREIADKTEETIRSRVESRRKDAAVTLSTVATTLLKSGGQLRGDQQAMAGEYVERAAKQLERAAQYVERADVGEMVENLEDFARRQPALFVGSAFALGFLGARFLKSSRKNPPGSLSSRSQFSDREVPTSRSYEGANSPIEGAR